MNWDLTLIYKTNEDYLKDFNSLEEDVLKIESLKGKLNTEEALVEYKRVNKNFGMKLSKIFTYCMLAYDLLFVILFVILMLYYYLFDLNHMLTYNK